MYTLYLVSVWLHLLAAIVWIGGMAFVAFVLAPYVRRPGQRQMGIAIIRWTGMRFRTIGWICIGMLLGSGLLNLAYRGSGWQDLTGAFWRTVFGRTMAVKLLLVVSILGLSVVHDFFIGPRAGELGHLDPDSPKTRRLRQQAAWIGRVNFLLALVVVALAVTLVRGWP